MNLEKKISEILAVELAALYNTEIDSNQIQFQKTRKDQEGDLTILVFPFVKLAKKSPATGW